MSILSGKIHKLPGVEGELTDQTPELRATIKPVETAPRATLSRLPGITGVFSRAGRWFRGVGRLLDILYRFLTATKIIQQMHEAKARAAPANEITANESANPKNDMLLTANEAKEINANRAVIPVVTSRLRAYIRAPMFYAKGLFVGSVAKFRAVTGATMTAVKETQAVAKAIMGAATGSVMRHRKGTRAVRKAKLLDADSATARAEVGLIAKSLALWRHIKAMCVRYEEDIAVGKTADAIAAPLEMVLIDEAAYDSIDAPLVGSEAYEISNSATVGLEVGSPLCTGDSANATYRKENVLSVYARFVAYIRAPVVHLKKVITAHFAGAVNADGAEAIGRKREAMNRAVDVSKADAAIAKSKKNIIKSGVDATAYFVPAEDDFASDTAFIADSMATADCDPARTVFGDESCEPEKAVSFGQAPTEDANAEAETDAAYSVKMAYWIDPVVVDGVLILRQAYSATQTEDVLVVV